MQSYPVQERFREKYSTRILDALPDMLTVFDHDANIIELASSPSTNHVEGINADNITHSNVKKTYSAGSLRKRTPKYGQGNPYRRKLNIPT